MTTPIIFIHGVMGSTIRLLKYPESKWNPLNWWNGEIWPATRIEWLRDLKLGKNGEDIKGKEADSTKILKSFGGREVYQKTFDYFLKTRKYDKTEFIPFHYDWRKNIRENAEKLEKMLETTPSLKNKDVIIVAHSMGGLVGAEFMRISRKNFDRVKKIFYLGTPFFGSPKMYAALKYGKEDPLPGWLPWKPDPADFKEILSNMPGMYQLLPTHSFEKYNEKGFFSKSGSNTLSLDQTYDDSDPDFNKPLMNNAMKFHNDLDTWLLSQEQLRDKAHFFLGDHCKTIIQIKETNTNESTYDYTQNGDGTVPSVGFENLPMQITKFRGITHEGLAQNTKVLDEVWNKIK